MENIAFSVIGSIIGGTCTGIILDWIRKPAKYKEFMKGLKDVRRGRIFSIVIILPPSHSNMKYTIVKSRKVSIDHTFNMDDIKHGRGLVIKKSGIQVDGHLSFEWEEIHVTRTMDRYKGNYFLGDGNFLISCDYDRCDGEICDEWNDRMNIGDEFRCPKCQRPNYLDKTEMTVDDKKTRVFILKKTK